MGIRGKINTIWWNIKINLQKLVAIMRIWIAKKWQNCTQKGLTEVKILQKVLGWATFLKHPVSTKGTKMFPHECRPLLRFKLKRRSGRYSVRDCASVPADWSNLSAKIYVDMNCQQICKISRKKATEVKIFKKNLGAYFFETLCICTTACFANIFPLRSHSWYIKWPTTLLCKSTKWLCYFVCRRCKGL